MRSRVKLLEDLENSEKFSTRMRKLSSKEHSRIRQLNDLAITYHQSGRLKEAKSFYNRILRLSPHHFDGLHMLGVLNCQMGETDSGLELLLKALTINPRSSMCLLNLGKAFHDIGKTSKAVSYYRDAISIKPDFSKAHNNLANALNDIGMYEEAITHCKLALKLRQNFFEAYNNMGIALFELGKAKEAIVSYQNALQINPNYPEAYNNMGIVLHDVRKPKEAVNCYKQAIKLKPDYPEAYNNLGIVLNNLNRPEEAIDCYKQAIALRPNYYEAMGNLAFVYERTNHIEKAIDLINQAIKGDSNLPTAHLVAAKFYRRNDNFKAALESILTIDLTTLHPSMKSTVLYEKGAVFDRLGDYENAFQSFTDANFIKTQHLITKDMEDDQYLNMLAKLEQYFLDCSYSPLNFERHDLHGSDPSFIIGFPRSGTTLLDKIVGAHPQIKSLEEKPMVTEIILRMAKLGLRYPEDLFQMDGQTVQGLRQAYFSKLSEFTNIKKGAHFIDKFPLNTVNVALIHRIFPNAKFIFALRHPADVCLSCFMQDFKLNAAMVHFLDFNRTAKLYGNVMDLWNTYCSTLPIQYHIIKYEELIANFDEETQKLLKFLDIEWDPVVKNYESHVKSYKIISTPSYHQVSEPLYKRSLFRWKNYKEHLSPIIDILRPYAKRFGYDMA